MKFTKKKGQQHQFLYSYKRHHNLPQHWYRFRLKQSVRGQQAPRSTASMLCLDCFHVLFHSCGWCEFRKHKKKTQKTHALIYSRIYLRLCFFYFYQLQPFQNFTSIDFKHKPQREKKKEEMTIVHLTAGFFLIWNQIITIAMCYKTIGGVAAILYCFGLVFLVFCIQTQTMCKAINTCESTNLQPYIEVNQPDNIEYCEQLQPKQQTCALGQYLSNHTRPIGSFNPATQGLSPVSAPTTRIRRIQYTN